MGYIAYPAALVFQRVKVVVIGDVRQTNNNNIQVSCYRVLNSLIKID